MRFGIYFLSVDFYTIACYIIAMATTIQVSQNLVHELKNRKMYQKESYEDIIWDLLEDSLELSEQTNKQIKQAEADIKNGKVHTIEEVKAELGL